MSTREKEKRQEFAIATTKGIISQVPFIGPIAAELVSVTIPNRRMERLEKLVACILAQRGDMPIEEVEAKMQEPEFVDLLDKGLRKVMASVGDERTERIANILSNYLFKNKTAAIANHVLSILDNLGDLELILFCEFCEILLDPTRRNIQDRNAFILDEISLFDEELKKSSSVGYDDINSLEFDLYEKCKSRLISSELISNYSAQPSQRTIKFRIKNINRYNSPISDSSDRVEKFREDQMQSIATTRAPCLRLTKLGVLCMDFIQNIVNRDQKQY